MGRRIWGKMKRKVKRHKGSGKGRRRKFKRYNKGRGHYAEFDPSNPISFLGQHGSSADASDSYSDSDSSGTDIATDDEEDWQAFKASQQQLFQAKSRALRQLELKCQNFKKTFGKFKHTQIGYRCARRAESEAPGNAILTRRLREPTQLGH